MQKLFLAVSLAAVAATPPALAQMTGHDHAHMGMQAQGAAPVSKAAKPADGEVRKVDGAKGTVVLKHGPLDALGRPAMTMEFKATDPKLLAGLKPGDKVRFTPEQGRNGELLVSSLTVVGN